MSGSTFYNTAFRGYFIIFMCSSFFARIRMVKSCGRISPFCMRSLMSCSGIFCTHTRANSICIIPVGIFAYKPCQNAWGLEEEKKQVSSGPCHTCNRKKGGGKFYQNFTKILPKLYRNLLRDSQNWKVISFSSSHNLVCMIRRDKYNKRILTFDLPVLYPPNEPVHFFMLFCLLDPDPGGLF